MQIKFKAGVVSDRIQNFKQKNGQESSKRYLGVVSLEDKNPIDVQVPLTGKYARFHEYDFEADFSTYNFNGRQGYIIKVN